MPGRTRRLRQATRRASRLKLPATSAFGCSLYVLLRSAGASPAKCESALALDPSPGSILRSRTVLSDGTPTRLVHPRPLRRDLLNSEHFVAILGLRWTSSGSSTPVA